MPIIEAIFAIGIVMLLLKVVPPALARRAERKRIREERKQRIESAKSAADVVGMLMVDRDLAREVLSELGKKMAEEDRTN